MQVLVGLVIGLSSTGASAKVHRIGTPITLRPVVIRNVAYNARGTIFAVPNTVSAGSVALYWVNEKGEIAPVPSRVSEKNFVRSSALYFLRKKAEGEPSMAFASLPELLSGYSVDFSETGDTLAIAGGERVYIYSGNGENWSKEREIVVASLATRAVFSHDGRRLAVLSEGKMLLFSTSDYRLEATVEPEAGSKFTDVAFSHDNTKCALFEFRAVLMDFGARIRMYDCANLRPDRDLPWFSQRPSKEPGVHLPLVTFSPGDTLLAVTLPATITGKIFLIRSNDGTIEKEFNGYCHAFSRDGTLFVADNTVYSVNGWVKLGKIPGSTVTCVFSPTERVLIAVTNDAIKRFRVEE